MSDGPEWFAPKRYGYGAGMPITWQGWALTVLFTAVIIALTVTLARKPLLLWAIVLPLVLLFGLIAARTTRGGWRWRWGKDD
jgi:hypothetical protein